MSSDWKSLSIQALVTARRLYSLEEPIYLRGAVNRAYYAAYYAVTAQLNDATRFAFARKNPAHDQLPGLIGGTIGFASAMQRRNCLKAIRRLRLARECADYKPGRAVDRSLALDCIRLASYVCRVMEVD